MSTATKSCASVAEYVSRFTEIARKTRGKSKVPDGPWYRGTRDSGLRLLPGLHWRTGLNEPELVAEFRSQAPLYLRAMTSSASGAFAPTNWEWYFLMQHYGLPTRLLDWTEHPLTAMFFALKEDGPAPQVWVLDPAALNKTTTGDPHVIAPDGPFSAHWLPVGCEDDLLACRVGDPAAFEYLGKGRNNGGPIAIYPARKNDRIVAQQGVFTVHGADNISLNTVLEAADDALNRIPLDPSTRMEMLEELEMCGVHELSLFPELPNLATHIKRHLGVDPL